ncbi:hypothetical protein Nmel_018218 [Mimus melanotis]
MEEKCYRVSKMEYYYEIVWSSAGHREERLKGSQMERNAWFGHRLSRDAVPLTAVTRTGSGATGTKSAASLPSGSSSAGDSGAGSCGWGSCSPRQTVCRICK